MHVFILPKIDYIPHTTNGLWQINGEDKVHCGAQAKRKSDREIAFDMRVSPSTVKRG